ncbi:MAG: hypothetical protein KAS23_07040 [Anaerohalosphaera sp.]|nr:hypothetical protein [Anaerohalosphaera sp.]
MICLHKIKTIGITLLLLFVLGCAYDEANRYYLKENLPPKNVNEVEILQEEPTQPYILVADFQACNVSFRYMQKEAAKVGADAVIVVPAGGNYSMNEKWAGKDKHSNSYHRLTGTAIKYKN